MNQNPTALLNELLQTAKYVKSTLPTPVTQPRLLYKYGIKKYRQMQSNSIESLFRKR